MKWYKTFTDYGIRQIGPVTSKLLISYIDISEIHFWVKLIQLLIIKSYTICFFDFRSSVAGFASKKKDGPYGIQAPKPTLTLPNRMQSSKAVIDSRYSKEF